MNRIFICATLATLTSAEYFGWTPLTDVGVSLEQEVVATIALKIPEKKMESLHEKFLSVSNPASEDYQNYLDVDELNDLVSPRPESVQAVLSWCVENGMSCRQMGTGDLIRMQGNAATISDVLDIELSHFTNSYGLRILKSLSPVQIPDALTEHVVTVAGLDNFPTIFPMKSVGSAPQVTPDMLKGETLYNITDVASESSKASMAVVEFQGQGYLPSDLSAFESNTNLPEQAVRRVQGGDKEANRTAGVEASLDIQYIIATGTGVPVDFYLQAGGSFDLLGWAGDVVNMTDPALVWSVSYGEGINGGIGGTIAKDVADRLNAEFEKFATRGMSVLVSSGDSGVYNREPVVGHFKFHPSYPSCLPAVTSVGATQLESSGVEDTGVSFSGGGFTPTDYYVRTSDAPWQNDAVDAYLNNSDVKLPPEHLWDRNGRGLPDVSAVGVDFKVWTNGHPAGVSGTSASCPAVAGIFALINDKLMEANKKPLGFLNPFIYQNMDAFRDIQKGYNDGGGLVHLFSHGFYAAKGWDPITGVGTPNYPALLKAAMDSAVEM